ncbi:hypothetical protein [Solibaculum mannosilyticum]
MQKLKGVLYIISQGIEEKARKSEIGSKDIKSPGRKWHFHLDFSDGFMLK